MGRNSVTVKKVDAVHNEIVMIHKIGRTEAEIGIPISRYPDCADMTLAKAGCRFFPAGTEEKKQPGDGLRKETT